MKFNRYCDHYNKGIMQFDSYLCFHLGLIYPPPNPPPPTHTHLKHGGYDSIGSWKVHALINTVFYNCLRLISYNVYIGCAKPEYFLKYIQNRNLNSCL